VLIRHITNICCQFGVEGKETTGVGKGECRKEREVVKKSLLSSESEGRNGRGRKTKWTKTAFPTRAKNNTKTNKENHEENLKKKQRK